MEFNEAEKSTILRCDVHDAILKIGNKCHATFFGLLDPLRLDFIKNDFQESPKMLYSVGSVSDIPMRITFFRPETLYMQLGVSQMATVMRMYGGRHRKNYKLFHRISSRQSRRYCLKHTKNKRVEGDTHGEKT
jgi:hypothetical protein